MFHGWTPLRETPWVLQDCLSAYSLPGFPHGAPWGCHVLASGPVSYQLLHSNPLVLFSWTATIYHPRALLNKYSFNKVQHPLSGSQPGSGASRMWICTYPRFLHNLQENVEASSTRSPRAPSEASPRGHNGYPPSSASLCIPFPAALSSFPTVPPKITSQIHCLNFNVCLWRSVSGGTPLKIN